MRESDAPGLLKKPSGAKYWAASRVVRDPKDFPLKTVRLHGTDIEIASRCRALSAELRQYLSHHENAAPAFDGTVAALIRLYETDEDSPYRGVRVNTRDSYDYNLRILKRTVGGRYIASLTRKDFAAWHRSYALPKVKDGLPRVRRAHGLMTMLRMLLGFGKSMRLDGCRDALEVLDEMTFATPERRGAAITLAQAEAVIDKALEIGARSIALGQAAQFELGLRQIDVIGQWTEGAGGIAHDGKRWSGGLTWADLTADRLAKRTSKTGQEGVWNPAEYPLLVKVIAAFAEDERIGPAVIDERSGQPYRARDSYSKRWRTVADLAGIPSTVWNMDSRAGALSEANDAGATITDMQQFATHATPQTTQRYIRRTGEAISRVAEARRKHREKE